MIDFFYPILIVQLVLAVLLFLVSIWIKRNDIADVAWGPGIALVAWTGAVTSSINLALPQYLILAAISLWAVRLGLRIYKKNRRKNEDPRYRQWRESWGAWFYPRSFLQVYVLQCLLMVCLAASFLAAVQVSPELFNPWLLGVGCVIWVVGFFFEVVGDRQLDLFLANPENKGKLMNKGLWHYTRHPNYFGEVTMWWGIWMMALTPVTAVWAVVSPLTITILILFVSGIPMLEAQMSKHPQWEEYKRKTSVLIPWWPAA